MDDRRDLVARNSFFLTASAGITAGLGFVFWVVAARLYSPAEVGLATSVTNSLNVLSYISLIGLNHTLIRFPAAPASRNGQVAQSITLVFGFAIIVGTLYVVGLPLYGPKLKFLWHRPAESIAMVLFCAIAAVNLLTNSVFISARKAEYKTLIDGLVQGLTKLALPFAFVGLGMFGIVAATGGGYVAAMLATLYFMRRRLGFRFDLSSSGTLLRASLRFSTGTYVASLLNLLPLLAVPLIVLQAEGPEAAAVYFVAFQIAMVANAPSHSVGESMFAEVSADESRHGPVLRRSAKLLAAVQIPVGIVLALGSGLLLSVFGSAYAEARPLLIVLAVATLAVAFNNWATYAVKLAKRMAPLIWSNAIYAAAIISLSLVWADRGLVWFGWAWCVGNLAGGLVACAALLRPKRDAHADPATLSMDRPTLLERP